MILNTFFQFYNKLFDNSDVVGRAGFINSTTNGGRLITLNLAQLH